MACFPGEAVTAGEAEVAAAVEEEADEAGEDTTTTTIDEAEERGVEVAKASTSSTVSSLPVLCEYWSC